MSAIKNKAIEHNIIDARSYPMYLLIARPKNSNNKLHDYFIKVSEKLKL